MAFDLLGHLMNEQGGPECLGKRAAENYRALTGAKTVLLFQNLNAFGGEGYRLLAVNPERRRASASEHGVQGLLHRVTGTTGVQVMESHWLNDTRTDDTSFGVSLVNPDGHNVGAILLLNLPSDPDNMPHMVESICFLSGYIGPIFHNALAHEFQARLITEKTGELADEVKRRRTAQEEWERTFNAIPDIITIVDRSFRIIRANRAAVEFIRDKMSAAGGALPEGHPTLTQVIGMRCHRALNNAAGPCSECPLVSWDHHQESSCRVMAHEDLGRIYSVASWPIMNDQGRIQQVVRIARDITEQKRLEEELIQAQKMEAIGTLAGGIAHDFNNILSAIIGYAEVALLDLCEEDPARTSIREVITAGHRAAELVKQILTFSRKSPHQKVPVSPGVIIKETLKMLRSSLPVTIEIREWFPAGNEMILADPTNVHQIVMNLCTNALHAMENQKGTLGVSLTSRRMSAEDLSEEADLIPGTYVVLTVSDTGCGISPEHLSHIFDPYFTTKSVERGTGLGLAVVHGIVRDCGGMILVDSREGRGTTFDVFFPVLENPSQQAEHPEGDAEPTDAGGQVLIVDDEPMILKLNRIVLEGMGCRVIAAKDGIEALTHFRRDPHAFDLLITDQTMPTMTGAELAEEVMKIRPDFPVILCTGYSAVLSEKEALAMGIRRYLKKPVGRSRLIRTVREVLAGSG